MKPHILLYGFFVFLFCFTVHLVIWRIRTPWLSSLILLLIFLGIPAVGSIFFMLDIDGWRSALSLSTVEIMEIVLLHVALSGVYIASYPAARAISPSLDIIRMISSSTGKKMTEEALKSHFAELRLVSARVDDLRDYRLIVEKNGSYVLLPVAKAIVFVFRFYRKLLNLPMGEG